MGVDTVFWCPALEEEYLGESRRKAFPNDIRDAWALAWLMSNRWSGETVIITNDHDDRQNPKTWNLPAMINDEVPTIPDGWVQIFDDGSSLN